MPDSPSRRRAAPLTELGHATSRGSWWAEDEESAPELRWPDSVDVYDRMRKQDAQIASVLRAVSLPVIRTRWWIEPNGARDEVVEHIATDLSLPVHGSADPPTPKRVRDRFSWVDHLRLAMLKLAFGHSFFEQSYRYDEATNRVHLHKLGWRPPRSLKAINTADDGGLVSIEQWPTKVGPKIEIPVSRLVAYVNDREGANWVGNSLLRPAYKHWLLKDRLLRVQTQTIDRNGMGIPVYTGAEDEESLETGLLIARGYRSGESAGAAIPNGAQLHLMGVEGEIPDAMPAIKYHDEQIARAVLAHFLNLDAQGGSYALAAVQADTFLQSLQTVAAQHADIATQHIIEDLVDANWGEDEPAPRVGFEEIGTRQQATAAALKTLVDAKILLPDRALEESARQQYGLPAKDWRSIQRPGTAPNPNAAPAATPDEGTDTGDLSVASNLLPVADRPVGLLPLASPDTPEVS